MTVSLHSRVYFVGYTTESVNISPGQPFGSESYRGDSIRYFPRLWAAQGDSLMPDVTADRRNSPRFALILAASIEEQGTDVKLSARTGDISRTGCYVDTLTPIPKGKSVRLVLTAESETFETTGKVIYASPGLGMGIQFDQPIDPRQLATLDRWLVKAAELGL